MKAIVVGVRRPLVAHSDGQWEVTVVYAKRIGDYVKRIRKVVFTTFYPEIGQQVDVRLI